MKLINKYIKKLHNDNFLIGIVLLIAGLSHGINMFHFPYLENDEGTYISQAWSLVTHGQLAPYAYWYDHAPAGWIFIALWSVLTGGFFTFGLSVFSGRVMMLVLHILMSYFLIIIAKRFTKKIWPGVIAVLIFSLSPLAIYFDRRVLLDNIMTFWVLLSVVLLLRKQLSLRYVALSALSFAIGVLSKENAIFFGPGLFYLLFITAKRVNRKFALTLWILISGSIISLYFLYAFLQSEFWPVGFFGDTKAHVSLLTTLQNQLGRGSGLPFWDSKSDFGIAITEWGNKDPYIIILSIAATFAGLILSIKNKSIRVISLFLLFFWLFLIRGKLIIDFYVIPLIPFVGLMTGMVLDVIVKWISKLTFVVKRGKLVYSLSMCLIAIVLSALFLSISTYQYTKDETTPQIQTIDWVKKNVDPKSYIIIDDYAYVDFHASRFPGDPIFPNADWFWKLSSDPAIWNGKYKGSWDTIQYITLSHEMLKQIKVGSQDALKHALDNAHAVQLYTKNTTSYLDIPKYISTNGDWMGIYQVKSKINITKDTSWNYYQEHFIHSYGQVVDPSNGNTTSEGQSYAMLRAVFIGDKSTFNGVYSWTKGHLQFRKSDTLFSWLWTKKDNIYQVGDQATASDADEDIALALILAYQKWHDPQYLNAAKQIIPAIWKQEVVTVNGKYYLLSGSNAKRPDGYLVNPSYLSPASYRLFAQIDPAHPWNQLSTDSYNLLNRLAGSTDQLPPNWILIKKGTGEITSANSYISDPYQNDYGYDAFRVFWRVALDAQWNNSKEAISYLSRYKSFFEKEYNDNSLKAIMTTNGKAAVTYNSLSTTTGALFDLSITDPSIAQKLYEKYFDKQKTIEQGYWGDKTNYYDQNWAWFATNYLDMNSVSNKMKND